MIERIKSVVRIKLLSLTVELTKRMPSRWYGKDDKTKMKYQSFTKTSNLSNIRSFLSLAFLKARLS